MSEEQGKSEAEQSMTIILDHGRDYVTQTREIVVEVNKQTKKDKCAIYFGVKSHT